MIGGGYWATGIIVRYRYSGGGDYGWDARVDFYDDGWVGNDNTAAGISTQGTLTTRYAVLGSDGDAGPGLADAIDAVKADAERLGVTFGRAGTVPPRIYYEGDGESGNYPPPPGWRALISDQALRLGWTPSCNLSPGSRQLV